MAEIGLQSLEANHKTSETPKAMICKASKVKFGVNCHQRNRFAGLQYIPQCLFNTDQIEASRIIALWQYPSQTIILPHLPTHLTCLMCVG